MSTFWYQYDKKLESQLVLQCAAETIQECFRNYRACRKDKLLKHELSLIRQIPLYASRIIKNFFVRFLYVTRKCKKKFIEVLQKHGHHQSTLVNTDNFEETINEEIDIDEFYEPEVAAAGNDDTTNENDLKMYENNLYSDEINTDVVNGFIDDIIVSAIEEINIETYDNDSNSTNKNPIINHLVDNIIQSAIQEIDDELSYYEDSPLLNQLVDGVVKSAIDALSDDEDEIEVEVEVETDIFHDQEIVSSEQYYDDELYEKNLKQPIPLYTTHIAVDNTIKQLDEIEDGMYNDDITNITPKNESSNSLSNKAIKQENQAKPLLSENDYLCKNVTHSTSVSPLRFNKNRNNLMIDKLFKEAVVCRCAIVKMATKEIIKILNAIDIDTSSHILNSPSGLSSSSSLSTTSHRSFNPQDNIFVPILHAASLAATLTKFIKDNLNNNVKSIPETADIQITQDLAEITSDNLKNLIIGSWDTIRSFILKITGSENSIIKKINTSSSLKDKLKNTIKINNDNGYNGLINPTNEKYPGRPSNWSSDILLDFLELLKLSDATMASFKLSNMKCIRFLDLDEDVLMPGQSYDIKSSLLRTRVIVYQHILNEIESLWDLNIRPWDIYNSNNPVIIKNTTTNTTANNTGRSTLTETTNHTIKSDSTITSMTKNKNMNSTTDVSSRTSTSTSTSKPKDLNSTQMTNKNNDDSNNPKQIKKSKSKDKMKLKTKKLKKEKDINIKTLYGDGLPTYEQFINNLLNTDKIIIEIAPFEVLLESWMLLNRTYGWNINYTDITELARQIGGNHGYLITSAEELYRDYSVPIAIDQNDSYNSNNNNQYDSSDNNNINNNNENINKVKMYDDMKYMRWVVLTINNAIPIGLVDDTSSLSLYHSLETEGSYIKNISPNRVDNNQHINSSSDPFNPVYNDQKHSSVDDINSSHTYNSGKNSFNSTHVPRLPPLPIVPVNSTTGGFSKKNIQIDIRKYPYITAKSKNNFNEICILIPLTCLRIEKNVSNKNLSMGNNLYDISLSLNHKHIMNNLRIGDQVQIVEEPLLLRACERFDWWDRPPADTLTELDKNRRIGVRVTLKTAIPHLTNTLTSSGRAVMDALPIEALFLIPNNNRNSNLTTKDTNTLITNNISHNNLNSKSKHSKEINNANNEISSSPIKTYKTNINKNINNNISSYNNNDNDNEDNIEEIETDEILDEQLVSSEQQNYNSYGDEDNLLKNENSEFSELEFPHTNIHNDYKSWMKTPDKINNSDIGYNRNENINNKNNKINQILSSASTPILTKQSSNITSYTNNNNNNTNNNTNTNTNNNAILSSASSSHIGVKTAVKTHEWSFPGTNTIEVENRPKSPHMIKQSQQNKTYNNLSKKKININDNANNFTNTNIIPATNITPNNVQSSSTFFRNKFLQKSTALLEKIDLEYSPDKDILQSPNHTQEESDSADEVIVAESKHNDENVYDDDDMIPNDRNNDSREGNHNTTTNNNYNRINRHDDNDILLSPHTTKNYFTNTTNTTTHTRPKTSTPISADIKKHLMERYQYKNNKIYEKEKQSKLRQMYTFNTSGDHGHKPIYTPDKLPDFIMEETQNNIDLGMSLTGRAFHKVNNNDMSGALDLQYDFQSNNIPGTMKRTSSAPSVSQGTKDNQNYSRGNYMKKNKQTDNLLMEDL